MYFPFSGGSCKHGKIYTDRLHLFPPLARRSVDDGQPVLDAVNCPNPLVPQVTVLTVSPTPARAALSRKMDLTGQY